MKNNLRLLAIVLAGIIGGCANLPDARVEYYLAQSRISFTVVRTVGCDGAGNLISASTVEPKATHFADTRRTEKVVFTELKGTFADSDVKFDFHDDGRLKGVNATSEGKGEEILKTAITLVKTAVAVGVREGSPPPECAFIATAAGDAKVLTLNYEGEVTVSRDTATHGVKTPIPLKAGKEYADVLYDLFGGACATVETIDPVRTPVIRGSSVAALLKARQPASVNMKVMVGPAKSCSDPAWSGKLPVAQLGVDYKMPIPGPPLFGKQVFAATFADSGALSSVQYASTTGAGQALNVGNALLTAFQGKTTAEKVLDTQAKADLILQQQRLVLCQADPTSCK